MPKPQQQEKPDYIPLSQQIEIAQWAMRFPALTVMVFLRPDLGFRLLNPFVLLGTTGLVAVMAVMAEPNDPRADDLLWFALLAFAFGMFQWFRRWRELDYGEGRHSYFIGTSPFEFGFLPGFLRRKRRIARFVDPIVCVALGVILLPYSRALGLWLVFAGFCLRGFEYFVFREMRDRTLDLSDSLIVAEHQAEEVERSQQGQGAAQQPTRGLPTGLGADIQGHVEQRESPESVAAQNLSPASDALPKSKLTRIRISVAYSVAVAADALHLFAEPITASQYFAMPGHVFEFVLDCVAMIATTLLLGFNWALLPSFFIELIPALDMVPTWTGCVAFVVSQRKKDQLIQRPDAVVADVAERSVSRIPQPVNDPSLPPDATSVEKRLDQLDRLRQRGLITEDDFHAKKQQILSEL